MTLKNEFVLISIYYYMKLFVKFKHWHEKRKKNTFMQSEWGGGLSRSLCLQFAPVKHFLYVLGTKHHNMYCICFFSDLKSPAQILLSENIYEEIRTPPLNSLEGSSSDSSTTFLDSSTETDSTKSTNTTQRNLKNAGKKLRNAPRQSRKSAGSLDSTSTGKLNLIFKL